MIEFKKTNTKAVQYFTLVVATIALLLTTAAIICILKDSKLVGIWKDEFQDFYVKFDANYQYTDSCSGEFNKFEIRNGEITLYDKYNQKSYGRILPTDHDSVALVIGNEHYLMTKCDSSVRWEEIINEAQDQCK